jgi:hypothetical protein
MLLDSSVCALEGVDEYNLPAMNVWENDQVRMGEICMGSVLVMDGIN